MVKYSYISFVIIIYISTVSLVAFGAKIKIHHTVAQGESVAVICDFYGVSQRDFMELNGFDKKKKLKVGETVKIPNVLRVSGNKYIVKEGDTLSSVASHFGKSSKIIAEANKLKPNSVLTVGRTIVIPDKTLSDKKIQTNNTRPSSILFLRIKTGERERLTLYNKAGEVVVKSVLTLSYLCRDLRGEQKSKRLNYKLVEMLQKTADKFPGKPIEIISGYRPNAQDNESQHALGRAVDFRMPGVSLKSLHNFCKTIPRSGCGYYPNAGFVHMDARSQNATWIDSSSSQTD